MPISRQSFFTGPLYALPTSKTEGSAEILKKLMLNLFIGGVKIHSQRNRVNFFTVLSDKTFPLKDKRPTI